MCLTLNRRPPVIDHHNADEPAMKNARNGFRDGFLDGFPGARPSPRGYQSPATTAEPID
jgi:hypothetical protein